MAPMANWLLCLCQGHPINMASTRDEFREISVEPNATVEVKLQPILLP
jgi:hypothetical protein